MSILIRGEKMPIDCWGCPCIYIAPYDLEYRCGLLQTNVDNDKYSTCRLPDCPLVEIETPHGRLIDAGALLKGQSDHESINTHEIWNAPTVVESEE